MRSGGFILRFVLIAVGLDVVLVQEEVMRCDLAGDGDTLGLGASDHVDGACGGEMLDMHVAAREARKLDVAGDLAFPRLRQANPPGPGASRRRPR